MNAPVWMPLTVAGLWVFVAGMWFGMWRYRRAASSARGRKP